MRVLRHTPCTVRSTVLVVALLAAIFIVFDSFSSLRWSRPSSFTPFGSESRSRAARNIIPYSPAATKSEVTRSNVTTSDVSSNAGHNHDDEDSGLRFSKKDSNLSRNMSQRTEEDDALSAGGYRGANTTSSEKSGTLRPGALPLDSVAGSKAQTGETEEGQQFASWPNFTSTVDVVTKDDVDEEFRENDSRLGAAPLFKDATSSNRAAGPDFALQDGERRYGASPRADNASITVLPHETTSEIPALPKAHETIRKIPVRGYDELSSFQKVEFDLWLARSAMRKVVFAQMNSSTNVAHAARQSVPEGEPWGDVYRNAAIFRQSYLEMERRFKVYTYQEGEEPLVHNGPCKEIYAVEGRFIQELQGDNPYVTDDPETAHVFFLPFSVAMMVTYLYTANSGDMSPLLRFVKDYVNVVSHKYPYWTRSGGADHFMLSCHDWGPHVSRADANLKSKAIRVLCNANISEGYIPTKDASLPEIHLVGGEIPAELGGLPASQRTLLAFFAGGDHGPVRPQLFKHWEGNDSDIHVYRQVPADGISYHAHMKSSKYCLCPGGYEVNSPRIVEAIYNDCVPVVIADNFVLPFSDVLDWKTFSVHVLEKDIPDLKTILQAIPMEAHVQMQARVKQVRHHFILNQPPQRYDVFHMILHSVWLRRLNIRLVE